MGCGFLVRCVKMPGFCGQTRPDSSLDGAFLSGSFPFVEVISGGGD